MGEGRGRGRDEAIRLLHGILHGVEAGINNEFADTRESTAIIAFYNGNRSRNARVIANIALDSIKYRCRRIEEHTIAGGLHVNEAASGLAQGCVYCSHE